MQFLHSALRFLDGLHLHEGKSLRALVVPVTYDLRVLHVPNAVEQFEQVAFGRVEGQVTDVKTRRSNFDRFRFARRPRLRGAIALGDRRFVRLFSVSKKRGDPLPECFLGSFRVCALIVRTAIAPSSGPAARTARTSTG